MSEIEKQFFETFGIEAKYKYKVEILGFNKSRCIAIVDFPNMKELQKCYGKRLKIIEKFDETITDRILLGLIVILGSIFIYVEDVETLKDHILNQCIMNRENIKHQVQSLFKEYK